MKIRTRLLLLTFLSGVLSLTILSGLFWLDKQQDLLFQHIENINHIQIQTNILRSQFRVHERYHDIDSIHQAIASQTQLKTLLDKLQANPTSEKTYINSMLRLSESLESLYTRMLSTHQDDVQLTDRHKDNSHHYLMDRLDNTILSMSEDSFKLAHHALKSSRKKSQKSATIMQILLISLTLIIVLSALQTSRLFRDRLKQLEMGIHKLARGELNHTIAVTQDEIGQLAQHFNQMTHKLRASTISVDQLQLEVDKRTSELEQQKETLKQLAEHDSLTGLSNRNVFMQNLETALKHCEDKQNSAAIFFIDLDQFKHINDSLGHSVGDAVLIEMARRFTNTLRKSDSLARIGGDEFTVIIDPIYQLDDASELAHKLITSLNAPYHYQNSTFYLHVSIGISLYPQDGKDALELMKNADAAMYQAKQAGGNRYYFYNREINKHTLELLKQESELRTALNEQQLTVYYQPQFNLATQRLLGVEALVRWQHPTKGMITPDQFIPIAEEKGLIHQLGAQVLNIACKQVKLWQEQLGYPLSLAVNVSSKQLSKQQLNETVYQALEKTQFPASSLELEITESCLLENTEDAIGKLLSLRAQGIMIALDDFGTGYSSLSYLKRLPLNKLKIDKAFIDNIASHDDDKAICKAIIALGSTLNLSVIAEGVESDMQAEVLKQEGCEQVQGYLFGKPMSAKEFSQTYLLNSPHIECSTQ